MSGMAGDSVKVLLTIVVFLLWLLYLDKFTCYLFVKPEKHCPL